MKMFLLVLSIITFSGLVYGDEATNKKTDTINNLNLENPNIDKFEFAQAYILGLGYLKEMYDRDRKFNPQDYSNPEDIGMASIKNNRMAITDFITLEDAIKEYSTSKNPTIRDDVHTLLFIIGNMIANREASIKGMMDLYSPEVMNNPQNFNQGKEMNKIASISAQQDELTDLFFRNNTLIAMGLIADSEGKMILGINLEQKNQLINLLIQEFGENVKEGLKKGASYIDSCGGALYELLTKRKALDEKD